MLSEPDFLFDDGDVVVRYIEPQGSGQSIGGTSTAVLVRAERLFGEVLVNNGSNPSGIVIKMQTHPDRAQVWQDYYNRSIESATDPGTTGSCTTDPSVGGSDTTQIECDPFDADRLVVSQVRIQVTLT